jgi:hypothetical protein
MNARLCFSGCFLLAVFPGALVLAAVPDNPCDERAEPPWFVPYRVRVLDNETGAPVSGVTITAKARRERDICCGPDSRCGSGYCYQEPGGEEQTLTTGSDGTGGACFTGYQDCMYLEEGCWFTSNFTAFAAPEVPERLAPGVFQEWILTRWEPGGEGVDQTLHVTNERSLAARFSPILHRHAYELQQGLSDLRSAVRDPGSAVRAFDLGQGGRMVYEEYAPGDLHVLLWECGQADTYGYGTFPQIKWQLDLADPLLHQGAPSGQRPLYYHVFPGGGGDAIIQYWAWFNGNDERQLPGPGSWHEGDWEWIAVRARWTGTSWDPENVNFYQHEGGRTYSAADCWWSSSIEPSYYGMIRGYRPDHPHVHAWVAANAHAMYNRNQLIFHVSTPAGDYYDHVDYNIADRPYGDHEFFVYDRLVPTGELETVHDAHFCTWIGHFTEACGGGGGMDDLAFTGTFGERHCPEGVPDILCDYFYYGCRSPVQVQGSHEWRSFTIDPDGFGNENPFISWKWMQPAGCQLGSFTLSPDGNRDEVRFSVPSLTQAAFAVATIASTTVRFSNEDEERRIWLPLQGDRTYLFDERRASGEGPVRIEIAEVPGDRTVAADLRLEVTQPHSARTPGEAGDGGPTVEVAGVVRREDPLTVRLSGLPAGEVEWSIVDVAGRRVRRGSAFCPGGCEWRVPSLPPAGVYFLRLSPPGAEPLRKRFIVLG